MRCPRCDSRDATLTEPGELCGDCEFDDREAGIHRFEVRRHGGRANCAWRVLYRGTDEAKAGAVYQAEFIALRQGGLELVKDGQRVKGTGAPLLRSRW